MFQEKLRLRLENGEPKCANCDFWAAAGDHIRPCGYGIAGDALKAVGVVVRLTTDLTVCSKWEMKDGQAKAEAPSE